MKTKLIWAVLLLAPAFPTVSSAWAQLAAPNAAGVAMGQVHLIVKDVEAERKFFLMLGGKAVSKGTIPLIEFPGVLINIRDDKSSGGTVGSSVNHFGFRVQSVAAELEQIKPLGVEVQQDNPQQAFVTAPDDVKVELLEDKTISVPIEMHHIHMSVTAPLEVQAWYVKNFGATPGKRSGFPTANLPGVELALSRTAKQQEPTKGRSLDHISFEVKDLDDFVKRLEASGVKMDRGVQVSANGVKSAYLTDPWGTYIELDEGLAPSSR